MVAELIGAPKSGLLTVEEAATVLRIGRNMCYELIRRGEIPAIRLGRLIRVPSHALNRWIAAESGIDDDPVAPTAVVVH